jgi:hypothetical protein
MALKPRSRRYAVRSRQRARVLQKAMARSGAKARRSHLGGVRSVLLRDGVARSSTAACALAGSRVPAGVP